MTHKPIIGITVAHYTEEIKSFPREFYVEAVRRAGGQPILVPPVKLQEDAQEIIQLIDGLLLTGGGDVSPMLFGEAPRRGIRDCNPERDLSEIMLTRIALAENLPLLGICKGIQVLVLAAGGGIYQDLVSECPGSLEHSQKVPRDSAWHEVQLAESRLAFLLEEETIGVNSFHHQAVSRLPEGFIANAIAPDGIIEGIEKSSAGFCIGVQWHPEAMGQEKNSQRLFAEFVKSASLNS